MKKLTLLTTILLTATVALGQGVAINETGAEPHSSAMLDVSSADKGLLVPRMTLSQRDNISNAAEGLLIYQTDDTPGFYYRTGLVWVRLGEASPGGWSVMGNNLYYNEGNVGIGTNAPSAMLHVADNALISGLTIGAGGGSAATNTALGKEALENNNSGEQNTAVGAITLKNNSTGNFNSANGYGVLQFNTSGSFNTAAGNQALSMNETGSYNTAIGSGALYYNKGRSRSTAIGHNAMGQAFNGTSAVDSYNTAVGYEALRGHAIPGYNSGQYNTAVGDMALRSNRAGSYNTASGQGALYSNTSGNSNTAKGNHSLYQNTTGSYNFAGGQEALNKSTTGNANVAIGFRAGREITTGSNNIILGYYAGNNITTGNNNIVIGNEAGTPLPDGNSQMVIGASDMLYGDLSNKRIGIGTTNPDQKLDIDGQIKIRGGTPGEGKVLTSDTDGTASWQPATSVLSCIDIDGNAYPAFVIGDQVWMAENLRVTKYRNGDNIAQVTDSSSWKNLTSGAFCWYGNDPTGNAKYGPLYNWFAVDDPRGLCPEGWRVPTDAEWTVFTDMLGGTSVAGGKLKAASPLWDAPNTDATNSTGFSGLPAGARTFWATFDNIGSRGTWWSSTENFGNNSFYRYLNYDSGDVNKNYYYKQHGFSVRCIRD
jgi:uncharacterized protein (TIGR02145 family)